MSLDKITVLIVEDSLTLRSLLSELLGADPEIQVLGAAANGREGVELTEKLRPDLVTMDVEMPEMDGLTATREIMSRCPTPILIVTAHAASRELNIAFEALKAGALDVVPKPTALDSRQELEWERDLLLKIKALAGLRLDAREPSSGGSEPATQ